MTDLLSQLRELADEWEKNAERDTLRGEQRDGPEGWAYAAEMRAQALVWTECADQLSALLPDQPDPRCRYEAGACELDRAALEDAYLYIDSLEKHDDFMEFINSDRRDEARKPLNQPTSKPGES